MRRLALIVGAVLVAAVTVLVGSCGGAERYQVRAIFDDASFIVPGEDVKIAGVRVGAIESMAVTPERKAAVVLNIENPAYQDFRRDARCRIRPQSLIGEQFVECTPTQDRAATSGQAPKLERIAAGPGKGQYLLPVEQNSISVALDLVGNVNRLPVRQRLTLILNELGVGLAGRGEDLNAVIRRSAPALQELDKVLALLASQNRQLKQLAVDSDTIMGPLAERRRNVTGFVRRSQRVAQATAERRVQLAAGLERFPTFLRETTPTMRRLTALAGELEPVAADLRAQAPAIEQVLRRTAPFARAARPALQSLGAAAKPGIPAIRSAIPITRDLRAFTAELRPVMGVLSGLLGSFQKNQGLERVMDYAYFQAQAINGFDSVSHFLRAGLVLGTCSVYATTPSPECAAKFSGRGGTQARSQTSGYADMTLARTAAVLAGRDPEDVLSDPAFGGDKREGSKRKRRGERQGGRDGRKRPGADRERRPGRDDPTRPSAPPTRAPTAAPTPDAGGPSSPPPAATAPPPPPAPAPTPEAGLLDFLFGGDR